MAQAVIRRYLTAEARVRAWVSPCEICDGQSGTGAGCSPTFSVSPVSLIPPWLIMLIYHLGDEQWRESDWITLPRHYAVLEVAVERCSYNKMINLSFHEQLT
jgi:hypothetical protein